MQTNQQSGGDRKTTAVGRKKLPKCWQFKIPQMLTVHPGAKHYTLTKTQPKEMLTVNQISFNQELSTLTVDFDLELFNQELRAT